MDDCEREMIEKHQAILHGYALLDARRAQLREEEDAALDGDTE